MLQVNNKFLEERSNMTIDMNISNSAGEVSKRPILSNAGNGELEKNHYICYIVKSFKFCIKSLQFIHVLKEMLLGKCRINK